MQRQQELLLLADDRTYVDVPILFVELNHNEMRYGVLDLIVQFCKGHRAQCS